MACKIEPILHKFNCHFLNLLFLERKLLSDSIE
nr:MAG TPA: hypothetical protein [Caudoviricetes sp.]